MSFAGSLILTAIGSAYYKVSRDQVFRPLPLSTKSAMQNLPGLYQQQVFKIARRAAQLSAVLIDDIVGGNAFSYPFKGIYELYSNFRSYSASATALFSIYLIMYTVISMVYWATITPVYTALFIFAGPIGIAVAWIHSLLHANMLTMMFLRVSHLNENLVVSCIKVNGYQSLFKSRPIRYTVSHRKTYFWAFYLPKKVAEYSVAITSLLLLLGVSGIPLLGPYIFHLLSAPVLSRIYFSKILRLKGLDNIQRFDNIFEHPGQYTAFGITAGFIDTIPLIAGISLSTNILGATLLGIDEHIITR
ncbi:hypothetical protein RNJ44_03459 [Nakaseomyces bracarensis]|uniref:Uncharacterized protein n=1 Tax=Nakaseomyces bracarensis TaxID=273131 RepID=A0ABR4NX45_9SACH